jgi:hypothetical protein
VILEGLVTTLGPDGALNVAPMGPRFEEERSRFIVLRPFKTSTTFRNLKASGEGVLHVTDDVLLLARAAIGPVPDVQTRAAEIVNGRILLTSARYYEFRVVELDETGDRASALVETVASGRLRDLFGLNRAKHAVVEAAILATRVSLIPIEEIIAAFDQLRPLVEKTGGPEELEAFSLLSDHVSRVKERR